MGLSLTTAECRAISGRLSLRTPYEMQLSGQDPLLFEPFPLAYGIGSRYRRLEHLFQAWAACPPRGRSLAVYQEEPRRLDLQVPRATP